MYLQFYTLTSIALARLLTQFTIHHCDQLYLIFGIIFYKSRQRRLDRDLWLGVRLDLDERLDLDVRLDLDGRLELDERLDMDKRVTGTRLVTDEHLDINNRTILVSCTY